MKKIHIYDKDTGKYMRSQEPAIDPLESQLLGYTVYAEYENSTEEELPEYGEHEIPFWNFELEVWEVKGQYKNLEVYNTETKTFEYCGDDDLKENQVWIDDKEGIEKFKSDYQKYIVDETTWKIIPNPDYDRLVKIREIDSQLNECDGKYNEYLDTPLQFTNGHLYKPKWVDDGTYGKLLTCIEHGIAQYPLPIWDATEKAENMVEMDEPTFMSLIAFLGAAQQTAFNVRKEAKSKLIAQKEQLEKS